MPQRVRCLICRGGQNALRGHRKIYKLHDLLSGHASISDKTRIY